uniref:Uncharacterized protein n=1 Tax=Picea sitchensis TaxID=3332 RepID=D5A9W5_PICSI|nr:unknown [Picea sitchensis]
MQLCLPLYHRQGLPCLCNLLSSDTLKQLDVNVTQAMELLPSVARMLPPPNAAKLLLPRSPKRNSNVAASVSVKMFRWLLWFLWQW